MATVRLLGTTAGYTELSAPAIAGNNTLTLPTGNGTATQALITDGSGNLYWNDVLLTSGSTITGAVTFISGFTSSGAVTFISGFTSSGDVTLNGQADLRFGDADSSNWVAFQAPATIGTNVTWTLPSGDGSTGQFLKTNGSGDLSWDTPPQALTKAMSYFYAGF